jgi:hypothetical protein
MINKKQTSSEEVKNAQEILDSVELSKEEKAELNLSKCARRQKMNNKITDFATAMRYLQMKFIVTDLVGKINKWNICDNADIDFNIGNEQDLIDYANEVRSSK